MNWESLGNNLPTIEIGLIHLITWFRSLTGLGLPDSKMAVDLYMATMHYDRNANFKFDFLTADIDLFIKFCALFTRGKVFIQDGSIFPVTHQALTGQALRDYINNK